MTFTLFLAHLVTLLAGLDFSGFQQRLSSFSVLWREAVAAGEAQSIPPRLRVLPPSNQAVAARLSPEEQDRLLEFDALENAALEAGDEEAQRLVSLAYVAEAAPNQIRDTVLSNLAKKARYAARPEDSLKLYEQLEAEGVTEYARKKGRYGRIKALFGLGRTAEAAELIRAIPQHGVGGLKSVREVNEAAVRSRYLLALGEVEEARLSFLSQSPPADADRRTRVYFIQSARRLTQSISIRGTAAEALGFQKSLLEKYPGVMSAGFAQEVFHSASAAGEPATRKAVLALARAQYPRAAETASMLSFAAHDAVAAGDRVAAADYYQEVYEHPAADEALKKAAAAGLVRLGVRPRGAPIAPEPDPAFGPVRP